MNITLLENHWYDATFSPSARFGGDEGEELEHEDAEAPEHARESGSGRSRLVAVLAPIFVVAGTAAGVAIARRLRARRAERDAELRQIEVDAIEYANDIAE